VSLPTHRKLVTPKVIQQVDQEIEADRKERRQQFDQAIDQLVDYLEQAGRSDGPDFYALCGAVWSMLMTVGLRGVEWVCAMRRQPPEHNRRHDAEGRCYHYYKQKTYDLRCVFGRGEFVGSQYVRGKNARSGDELCPQMSRLGLMSLAGGFGPRLALECAHMTSMCAFEPAKRQLERFLGYVPSTRTLQGLVDRLGPMAGQILEEAECPRGDVLVVQFDGRGLPKIRDEEYDQRCKPHKKGADRKPRRRRNDSRYLDSKRATGKNKSKKQEVTVGIIYGLERIEGGGWRQVDQTEYVARMGDRTAVMKHLGAKLAEAEARDKPPERILFLSDGATDYEDLVDDHLPDRTEHVIDYYHVCEYLWNAAGAVERTSSFQMKAFVRLMKGALCEGRPRAVLGMLRAAYEEIPKRGPGTKDRRERVQKAIDYITRRRDMMPYDQLLDEKLEIGSGAIESAVRQVVELRFDGPGMRWGDDRPNRMLNLVCTRLSRRWDQLAHHLRDQTHQARRVRRLTPVGVQE